MTKGLLQGLERFWEAWKRLAHKIGTFQARVLLTLLYIILVLPFGICVRVFSDSLRIKKRPTEWLPRPLDTTLDIEWARRQ